MTDHREATSPVSLGAPVALGAILLALIACLALGLPTLAAAASTRGRHLAARVERKATSKRKSVKRSRQAAVAARRRHNADANSTKPSSKPNDGAGESSEGGSGGEGGPAIGPSRPVPPAPVQESPASPPPVLETPASPPLDPESPTTAPAEPAQPSSDGLLMEAGCEHNLDDWNTAGVGDVVPTVTTATAMVGVGSCRVALEKSETRSELILGGEGNSGFDAIKFTEGSEYWYGFAFNIQSMVYGHPGAHNLIMQFKSEGEGGPSFGLQLWNYAGDNGQDGGKGLWSSGGGAMETDHFLAPVGEHEWHDVAIHFRASSTGAGFYELYLDGRLLESRQNVSMIVPGHSYAYVKNGIYRGSEIPGTSEIDIDAARLGTTRAAVEA